MADLHGAGGGRAAKGPSVLSQPGGGAVARSHKDFPAGERERVATAEGSGTQIRAIYQEWAARAKAVFGEQSTQYENVVHR